MSFTLQLSIVLGMGLTVVLGLFMKFGAGVFTKDAAVIDVIHKGIPVRALAVQNTRTPYER